MQDWVTFLRQRLGIRAVTFTHKTRDRIRPVKYILLACLLLIPVAIANLGLHGDFGIPFCQICPAKPILPLFVGTTRYFALDFTNAITLVFSILSMTVAALTVVGVFFKPRFFCLFCPMLALLHLVKRITPLRLRKKPEFCHACGNCQRMCPVDIRRIYEEKDGPDVQADDCMLCLKCVESCEADEVLSLTALKHRLFSSSQTYASKHLPKHENKPNRR